MMTYLEPNDINTLPAVGQRLALFTAMRLNLHQKSAASAGQRLFTCYTILILYPCTAVTADIRISGFF